jgi:hypothetical protein
MSTHKKEEKHCGYSKKYETDVTKTTTSGATKSSPNCEQNQNELEKQETMDQSHNTLRRTTSPKHAI